MTGQALVAPLRFVEQYGCAAIFRYTATHQSAYFSTLQRSTSS